MKKYLNNKSTLAGTYKTIQSLLQQNFEKFIKLVLIVQYQSIRHILFISIFKSENT